MRPSCAGRLAKLLSARSSNASLRLHAASGKLVSLHKSHCFGRPIHASLSLCGCSSCLLMGSAPEHAQHPNLK